LKALICRIGLPNLEEQINEVLSVKRSEGIMIDQPVTISQDGNVGQVKELREAGAIS